MKSLLKKAKDNAAFLFCMVSCVACAWSYWLLVDAVVMRTGGW